MPDADLIALRPQLALDAAVAAHRQLLVLVLSLVGQDPARREALAEAVRQKLVFHDAHEDPGLEADLAFAFERRVDEELRRILADVEAALSAPR